MDNVLAIILAGGRGQRVSLLTQERAKPAIPFAGKYRIIDFSLSNCVNSEIYNVAVLSQYRPLSLADHIGVGIPWDLNSMGRVVRVVPAHLAGEGRGWYKGTADAVYQNLQYIEEQGAELILILSGDHAYVMDFSDMIRFHQENNADVTIAATPFPREKLERFGTIVVDETGRVTKFREKVKSPKSNLVSMGIYLFNKDILRSWLEEDAQNLASKRDFGRSIFPSMVNKSRVYAHEFSGYWRDVGTVEAYWKANMDLLEMSPSPLYNADWPLRTKEGEWPPAIVSRTAGVINSLISGGCLIDGHVESSIMSPGVTIMEGAVVKDSIIMSGSVIGSHSRVSCSIVDKEVVVQSGCKIGYGDDFKANREHPKLLDTGINIVGKRAKLPPGIEMGRNCAIYPGVMEADFTSNKIQSGETIKPGRRKSARKYV